MPVPPLPGTGASPPKNDPLPAGPWRAIPARVVVVPPAPPGVLHELVEPPPLPPCEAATSEPLRTSPESPPALPAWLTPPPAPPAPTITEYAARALTGTTTRRYAP